MMNPDDKMSLDKMNLDRKDLGIGGDNYDPFYKYNVRLDYHTYLVENGFGVISLNEFHEQR